MPRTPELLRAALHTALAKARVADAEACLRQGELLLCACHPPLSRSAAASASLEWRDEGDGLGMSAAHIVVRLRGVVVQETLRLLLHFLFGERCTLS